MHTILTLHIQIGMPDKTVQTQVSLLLKEQTDQGLHCLSFLCLIKIKILGQKCV